MVADAALPKIRHAFLVALGQTIGTHLTLPLLRAGLQEHRSYRLTEGPAWLNFTNDLYARFQGVLTEAFVEAANAPGVVKAEVRIVFGVTNPEAIAYAQRYAAQLVRDLSMTSQYAIRQIITRMMQGTLTVDAAARLIRATIGLTPKQAEALERYRQALDAQGSTQVDRLTEARGRTMLAARADAIARTESMRAANEGQAVAWRHALQQGTIAHGEAMKMYLTASDELVCPICAPLDGQLTPIDGDWDGNAPPLHPNCRCSARLVYLQADGSFPTRRPRGA